MTKSKGKAVDYQLDYAKCTHDELRGFIKSRTGRKCTSDNFAYLAGKLRSLDKNVTFRFLDLPVEMRLLVYGELFVPDPWRRNEHRSRGDRNQPEHCQILTTCREIQMEAEAEMYQQSKMVICINTAANSRMSTCEWSVNGCDSIEVVEDKQMDSTERSSLGLRQTIPKSVVKARHLELRLCIDMYESAGRENRFRHVYRVLFALAAVLRESKLLDLDIKFELKFNHGKITAKTTMSILRPLYWIKDSVNMSFEGVPDEVQQDILSHRLTEDSQPDSILRYQEVMEHAENAAELLHSDSFQHIESIFKLAALSGLMEKARILGPASKFYKQHEAAGQQAVEDLEKFEIIGKDCVRDVTRIHGYLERRETRSHDVMSIYDV
jgi:hypothetical protein